LNLTEGTLRTILSNGDLRKSINTLQTLQGIDIIPEIIPTPQ
jgi:DNA polymerase III delta prime subunit